MVALSTVGELKVHIKLCIEYKGRPNDDHALQHAPIDASLAQQETCSRLEEQLPN